MASKYESQRAAMAWVSGRPLFPLLHYSIPDMSDETRPRREVDLQNLNWLGKSVYIGGAFMRLTANAIDATAKRVQNIAARSKEAFDRELDPNIDDARVLEEYPHPEHPADE